MSLNRGTALVLACVAWVGCGDKVTVNDVEQGLEGESCRSRNDCDDGLMCLDMVCARGSGASGSGGTGAGDGGTIRTRSELGESCQTRADCAPPLACIENSCRTGFAADAAVETTPPKGKRGESCEASNDCEQGLACIGSRCLESDFDLDYVAKECFLVQCATSDDCCADFRPNAYTQEQCDTMRTNCEDAEVYPPPVPPGITSDDCYYWTLYCRCMLDCVSEQCITVPGQYCLVDDQCTTGPATCVDNHCVECTTSTDCFSSLYPYCVGNACVQCMEDGDCTTTGSRCVSGTCQSGCTANEHCGLLQACQMGECVDVGCTSDRQCYFLTGDDRSRCVNTRCETPCANDAECAGDFQICADGVCAFAGCNSDEECRAVLGLADQTPQNLNRAVCRAPE